MKSFLENLAANRPLVFGILMTILMLIVKIPFAPFIVSTGGAVTTEATLQLGLLGILLSFLFLPVETFLGQSFPIWLFQKLGAVRWRTLCLASAACFGLLHLGMGIAAFFIGFSGGMALALCWLCWQQESAWKAFLRTTLVHAAHNAIAFTLYLGAELAE